MKKILCVFMLIVLTTIFTGCGSNKNICTYSIKQNKQICKDYEQKGLFDMDEKSKKIEYKPIWGNVFWGILLSETLIMPFLLFGWYLWEPANPKTSDGDE